MDPIVNERPVRCFNCASCVFRTMWTMSAFGWWLTVVVFVSTWNPFVVGQQNFEDQAFICNDGFKVSAIKRGVSVGKNVGPLTVECERLPATIRNPTCLKSEGPLVCNGTAEACHGHSWVGGFIGYELDASGALLLQPVCCRSEDVRVDVQTCKGERLNAVGAAFDRSIHQRQIFQSFKCWRQFDLNEVLQDFIWKPTVCEIVVRNGVPNKDDTRCNGCNCECGPFTCPEGGKHRQPVKFVHKRLNPSTCQCLCECNFKCV